MIPIELTEEQRRQLAAEHGQPVDVIDPATNRTYVLLAREHFEKVRAVLSSPASVPQEAQTAAQIVPPGIFRSQQAFWRDLPQLLLQQELRGRWIAYHGDDQLGTAPTKTELMREIVRRGIPRDDYYVGRIHPQTAAPWEPVEVESVDARTLEDLPDEP